MSDLHRDIIRDKNFSMTNRFINFVAYEPLSANEFRTLTQNEMICQLNDNQINRLWLIPVQRHLQQEYRIDQRNYDAGSIPTLSQLEEDFKVATAITVDHFYSNEEGVVGLQTISGAGTRVWSHKVPPRAQQLLARYERSGGRVGRA